MKTTKKATKQKPKKKPVKKPTKKKRAKKITKFLAIGLAKSFDNDAPAWSISVDMDKLNKELKGESSDLNDPTLVANALYKAETNKLGIVPSRIILVGIEKGVPVVKENWEPGDYN